MGLNISLGAKKAAKPSTPNAKTKIDTSAAKSKAPTKAAAKTGVVKQGAAKKPEAKAVKESTGIQEIVAVIEKHAADIIKHDAAVKEAAKDKAVHDNALKKSQGLVISEALDLGIADTASAEFKVDGKIITLGAAGESTKVTDAVKAYNMLESIEEGLGQSLMSFSITDLKKHLTSKQLEQVTETKADPKKRRVGVKDDKK
ncbi:hypothetical protein [Vibrio phage vB_VhaS-a]|nr:hypothetical protein [Vibrio phage vB_VhaS-a]